MKKRYISLFIAMILLLGIVGGCSSKEAKTTSELTYQQALEKAKGTTVNIYMWGGSQYVNEYMDTYVKKELKKQYDIELKRIPVEDIKDTINKIGQEKKAGKNNSSVDLIWLNGENFKSAKKYELLEKNWLSKLPNYESYVDKNVGSIAYDFGEPIDNMEAPFGRAQFVLVYDSEKVKNPPKSAAELKEWVKQNPGKFTYPSIPDFTGSAFVRNILMDLDLEGKFQQDGFTEDEFKEASLKTSKYLQEIEPYLWREGKTYPENSSKLDKLYSTGEVYMTMSYNPFHAMNNIKSGVFKKSSRTLLLDRGTLSNTHYLSIPFNSSNKEGALVVANFLMSPEAQIKKLDPKVWGDGTVLEIDRLDSKYADEIKKMDFTEASVSQEELQYRALSEIKSEYVDILEAIWNEEVLKK